MPVDFDCRQDALYQLGYQKGYQREYQKGYEEGYREGYQEGREELAFNMIRKGMTVELISELVDLPAEPIARLRQQPEAGR